MKCTKCNSEIPDNSKFCLHCGAKVEIQDGIVCKCGYKNPLDARFCTECGSPLTSSKHTQTNLIQNWHSIRGVIRIEQNQSGKKYLYDNHNVTTGMWTYDLISPMNKYLAVVVNNGLAGVLHCDGSLVIPCRYDSINLDMLSQNIITCCSKTTGNIIYNITKHLNIVP